MAYNYNGYPYNAYPQYNPMAYQQQPQNVVQQPNSDNPFSEAHFGTIKEAEGHIVAPNRSVLFLNSPLGEIYIKTADNMGNPSLITFKRVNNQPEPQQAQFDPNLFVKRDELNCFITKNDLGNFTTKDDLKDLYTKLDTLQRQIKIKELERGTTNGSTK